MDAPDGGFFSFSFRGSREIDAIGNGLVQGNIEPRECLSADTEPALDGKSALDAGRDREKVGDPGKALRGRTFVPFEGEAGDADPKQRLQLEGLVASLIREKTPPETERILRESEISLRPGPAVSHERHDEIGTNAKASQPHGDVACDAGRDDCIALQHQGWAEREGEGAIRWALGGGLPSLPFGAVEIALCREKSTPQ